MVSPVNIYTDLRIKLHGLRQEAQLFLENLPEPVLETPKQHYTSPKPLPLPKLTNTANTVSVRSGQTVKFASATGIRAVLQGEPITQIQPLTRYGFPLILIDLIAPNQEIRSLELSLPPFQTFAEGVHERHLMEYISTLLDLDLQLEGFRCERKNQLLVFSAEPEKMGWNIQIKDLLLLPLPADTKLCKLGLSAGLSSLDEGQIRGCAAATSWGRYQLNGIELDLKLIHGPQVDLRQAREALLEQINAQSEATGVKAWIDPEGHLLLKLFQPEQQATISLRSLPAAELPAGTLYQALDLPEGRFGTEFERLETNYPEIELGRFKLNGEDFELGTLSVDLFAHKTFTERINSQQKQTETKIWLDAAGFLHFEGSEIILEPQTPNPWDLEKITLKNNLIDWEQFTNAAEKWIHAANQCLSAIRQNPSLKPIELPLRQVLLAQMPGQMGVQVSLAPETGLQLELRSEILVKNIAQMAPALTLYLKQMPLEIEKLLQRLESLAKSEPSLPATQISAAPRVENVPALDFSPQHLPAISLSPKRASAQIPQTENELPDSSFDHKI
jgi:hypothetical protein